MTLSSLINETPERLNVMLAEAAGYTPIEEPESPGYWCVLHKPTGRTIGYRNGLSKEHAQAVLSPKFCSDLNAVAEVEAKLTDEQHERFRLELSHMIKRTHGLVMSKAEYRSWFSATARQRTIALILTLQP